MEVNVPEDKLLDVANTFPIMEFTMFVCVPEDANAQSAFDKDLYLQELKATLYKLFTVGLAK